MSADTSLEYGAYHISNNKVEYNPQRKDNFTLVISNLTNIARVGTLDGTTDTNDLIANGQEQIILSLRTCDTPKCTLEDVKIYRGNSTIHFAGKPSFSTISFEAYDYIGSDVKDTLLAWQNLAYNSKYDYIASASAYKKSCQLLQLTPDAELVRYWEIKGAWLSEVSPGSFTVEDGGAQVVTCTMVYDWAQIHLPDDYTV